MKLYNQIVNDKLLTRRINITANNLVSVSKAEAEKSFEQINLFVDYDEVNKNKIKEESERKIQKAMIDIKSKYGKNAIIKGMNLEQGGTTIERNRQIGGHKE